MAVPQTKATHPGRRRRTVVVAALGLLGMVAALVPALTAPAGAADPAACSRAFQIDQTLATGGRWQMCWEMRPLEGVVLHDVTYTPPGGTAVLVLGAANLAQIHVPYDDGAFRFHDESDFGIGNNINDLQPGDCPGPGSTRLLLGSTHVLCQQVKANGYAYKDYAQQTQGSSLSLFSVAHIGSYNYVIAWNFDDDGTIRPEVGATGSLQRYGGGRTTGWDVGQGRYAVAHLHNYYWRLDFDINGADGDRVQELAAQISSDRLQYTNTRASFFNEVARRVLPGGFRSWRVRDRTATNADGHSISYEVVPNNNNVFRGSSTFEPFTQNEFYVTRNNSCERFASHNPTLDGACGDNLADFANGESTSSSDLVVWYGTSFHHLPRDEDENHMDVHWSGFSIVPRDLTATYPIP